jgi:hypothetical protein
VKGLFGQEISINDIPKDALKSAYSGFIGTNRSGLGTNFLGEW